MKTDKDPVNKGIRKAKQKSGKETASATATKSTDAYTETATFKAAEQYVEAPKTTDHEEDILTKKAQGAVLFTLLPLLSLLAIVLLGFFKNAPIIDIAKIGTLTLVLTAASVFFIRLQEEEILKRKYAKSIITIGYLISILFIMLPIKPDIYSFWMIGGLLVAMLIDTKLGLLIYFNLTFILSITLSLRPETTIQFLIMGVLMSLLSGDLKNKTTVVYAAVILLSTNITLAFVINNFIFDAAANYNYLSSFFSIAVVLTASFLLSAIYNRIPETRKEVSVQLTITEVGEDTVTKGNEETPIEEATMIKEPITVNEQSEMQEFNQVEEESLHDDYRRGTRTSYELLINDTNGLLLKLKEFSETIYQHSLLIGDISGRAADAIGADCLLAKAGGLYHEIGKINGKEYIDEGQKLAEEYMFPKELKSILRQHNIKHEKPSSVEAAIVMLTDTVVSTIDYIRKTEDKKFTIEKIIDNIFQLRMDKGTFDESGLSVKDYKQLKDFYLKEFK